MMTQSSDHDDSVRNDMGGVSVDVPQSTRVPLISRWQGIVTLVFRLFGLWLRGWSLKMRGLPFSLLTQWWATPSFIAPPIVSACLVATLITPFADPSLLSPPIAFPTSLSPSPIVIAPPTAIVPALSRAFPLVLLWTQPPRAYDQKTLVKFHN